VALGLFAEAIDHDEAQPDAVALLLGCEERLEHPITNLGGHAFAGIGDRQLHVFTCLEMSALRVGDHVAGIRSSLQ
jgi:hypothetical protein